MTKTNSLAFSEPKRLPSHAELQTFGIVYNSSLQQFETKYGVYQLDEFKRDYYEMEFKHFRDKLQKQLGCNLDVSGYLIYNEAKLPLRDLTFFANKELKFAKELQTGRQRGDWVKTVSRDVCITTHQTNVVSHFIDDVIKEEHLDQGDVIMLKYLNRIDRQHFALYKIFNSVDVRASKSLLQAINVYSEGFFGQNEDYSVDIDRLELDIIKALKGGCLPRELKVNDAIKRVVHPKATNNNCFFKCIQPFVPQLRNKLLKSECNKIRNLFSLLCGRKFKLKHNCNTNMIVYKKIMEGKDRFVMNQLKRDKRNFNQSNEDVVVVYYDIETHTRIKVGESSIHTPYIVGFVDNISNKFNYITGRNCMERFIKQLVSYNSKKKVYLNAFNGSKFDHYEFIKQLNKLFESDDSLQLNKLLLNNGAILKATVGNIECFDISKHLTGTLRRNLEELGCNVQKGEFDYSLGDDWDKMSKNSQTDCINYLECDVMGLKELSEKLNQSCYDNFGVNLYKFISTSQLTYAIWVEHWYKESTIPIYLQTPEQEKFFRQSIYGGRTYKYKHNFVSTQRDAFLSNNLNFDDIEDYLIDADVNSLYPAAMKEEFPVGVPILLDDEKIDEFNQFVQDSNKCPKFGIFRIEFITNKNLIDSILPRRVATSSEFMLTKTPSNKK